MQVFRKRVGHILSFATLTAISIGVSSCGGSYNFAPIPTGSGSTDQGPPAICNPLSGVGTGNTSSQNGISGQLYYFDSTTEIQSDGLNIGRLFTTDFFQYGHLADATLFFSSFDAPPQSMGPSYDNKGFQLSDGSYLQAGGNILYQYFAFKFNGYLQLPSSYSGPTYKQFALISDDGGVLNINNGAVTISNDGEHCSSVATGQQILQMTPGQTVPFELDYFQGPAPGLTLALVWRTVADPTNPGANPSFPAYCGGGGTDAPSVSAVGSDWELVPPSAFVLSNGQTNPCI